MEKIYLKNIENFKKWIDENSKYDLVPKWKYLPKYYKENFPTAFPCILVFYQKDGGNQAGDSYIWEFVYFSDFEIA